MIEDPTLLSLLSELNEGDSDDPIAEIGITLDKMDALENADLAALLCCKEGIAKIKEKVVIEDPSLRSLFIERLGKMVIRVWMVVNSEGFDIEGYVRVTSRTESIRMVEDFMDMAIDLLKSFSKGVLGHAPASDASQSLSDDIICSNAYSEVITDLLNHYLVIFEPLDHWTDALTGIGGSGSLSIHTASIIASKSTALSLLPLIKPTLLIVFKDRYQLITRCRSLPSYSYSILRLVSAFMRVLLSDLSVTASIDTVLVSSEQDSGGGQSIFAVSAVADVTESTLSGHLAVPVYSYIKEWVENCLLDIVCNSSVGGGQDDLLGEGYYNTSGSSTLYSTEIVAVIKDCICLTQHHIMSSLRTQVR